MKRLVSILIVSVLLLFSISVAGAADIFARFSTYGVTEKVEDLFDGDTFAIDLFLDGSVLKAYIVESVWIDNKIMTRNYTADVKSKAGEGKTLYFILENGTEIKGHYDENGYYFWLDFNAGSIKLEPQDEFNSFTDLIKER